MATTTSTSIPLDMMFEPTGILLKDYNAYCEVDGLLERDDLIDAVSYVEVADPISGAKKLRTRLVLRNPPRNNVLPQRDFLPMAKAIPHCSTLDVLQLTGCGVTEVSVRNLAEAVYRSPSITSVTVDFNSSSSAVGLTAEPKPRDDRPLVTDIVVTGTMFRNGILAGLDEAQKKDEKGRPTRGAAAQPVGAKAKAQAAREAEELERASQPISIPEGWAALCFSGIQHLCLRGNKINDGDVVLMARHLEEPYSDLRCLNLWGNEISDAGAKELAQAVAVSRRLTALDLGQNKIGDAGVEAWAKLFLTSDASVDEAMRLRSRTLTVLNTNGPVAPLTPPTFDPLPPMPSFAEIFAANGDDGSPDGSPNAAGGAGRESSSAGAMGKSLMGGRSRSMNRGGSGGGSRDANAASRVGGRRGGDNFSIADRSRSDFDRDLVKLEDGKIRVPGCIQITSLSFAHNSAVSDRGVLALERVLKTQEPASSSEAGVGAGGVPPHYCSTLALQRLEVANSNISDHVMNKLAAAMQKVVTRRAATQT